MSALIAFLVGVAVGSGLAGIVATFAVYRLIRPALLARREAFDEAQRRIDAARDSIRRGARRSDERFEL